MKFWFLKDFPLGQITCCERLFKTEFNVFRRQNHSDDQVQANRVLVLTLNSILWFINENIQENRKNEQESTML